MNDIKINNLNELPINYTGFVENIATGSVFFFLNGELQDISWEQLYNMYKNTPEESSIMAYILGQR